MAPTTTSSAVDAARADVTIDYSRPLPCAACGAGTARRVNGKAMHGGICETIVRTRQS